MRHKNKGRKFGLKRNQRRAFLKSLAANLILKGKIKTTQARAKEMRTMVERLITQTKTGELSKVRLAGRLLSKNALSHLVKNVATNYKDRQGGYTRITKLGRRSSDSASMVIIELV
ncbi:MAG: 50S ribosomal protein L17 [Candidatus Portnoybacteria bacterium RBG_13_41_18]|uniref:50S ribosomal protein L17 n=1 Tax=Candidatus Portnoybacteria bacterium RBG_13_41_18 TaxID=1801991 RepID=A0A1G2F7B0_9BACT|nr:MAG: 50S ribosomal protein L17 [Candidatus Portnoybacteria bacterium RBG_13_41_18]